MGKIDDVGDSVSNGQPGSIGQGSIGQFPSPSSRSSRYQREGYDPYYETGGDYGGRGRYGGGYGGYSYGDRYASRYGSVLSEVETETDPRVPPVHLEHWFSKHWRPAMAWLYFSICAFDFIAAPMFTFWFAYFAKIPYLPWAPLTLQGGGLIHVSLGAIIGVYTWSRTREKLAEHGEYSVRRDYR